MLDSAPSALPYISVTENAEYESAACTLRGVELRSILLTPEHLRQDDCRRRNDRWPGCLAQRTIAEVPSPTQIRRPQRPPRWVRFFVPDSKNALHRNGQGSPGAGSRKFRILVGACRHAHNLAVWRPVGQNSSPAARGRARVEIPAFWDNDERTAYSSSYSSGLSRKTASISEL